ncbi:predicted protein [Streptomyces viridosporus ATCC 14672]|uniref:Predicted protein n=1 Tax=Streptomyces viridosporus (strain ATCC 14672 / DSM 40746 / JCM 4963 / KCTC 9882 / NRRL B-12104 / FH 1290) TaxID=566461 RepID=D5ZNT6_STRV1|nr:predicted protein [Streptomyces viridosporus ATCC 14672]
MLSGLAQPTSFSAPAHSSGLLGHEKGWFRRRKAAGDWERVGRGAQAVGRPVMAGKVVVLIRR